MSARTMQCRKCGCEFEPTESMWRHKSHREPYCSAACRIAANPLRKPHPMRGPCLTCGKHFASRTARAYCNIKCYVESAQFKKMLLERADKQRGVKRHPNDGFARKGGAVYSAKVQCLECGCDFYSTKHRADKRKFCSRDHYRAYMAKRFDRWIANPATLTKIQGYDDFMMQPSLPCIVDGCGWTGDHLAVHCNQAHGIRAADLKRAAGFNLHTGLIGSALRKIFSERPLVGVATSPTVDKPVGLPNNYRSSESIEHYQKARALMSASDMPPRICAGCGVAFSQLSPLGRTKFCSVTCRNKAYRSSFLAASIGSGE